MTLDEMFEKYSHSSEDLFFYRTAHFKQRKVAFPNVTDKEILLGLNKAPIEWLKGLKAWGNEESRKMGFMIPFFMIEAADADDWQLYSSDQQ